MPYFIVDLHSQLPHVLFSNKIKNLVQALIKKHEDFEKSLAAQEEKIKALDEFATKLIDGEHYAAEDVAERRALLLERRAQLLEKSGIRKTMLEDSYRYLMID